MIFLDTNFFLRALTRADIPKYQPMHDIAADVMRRADRGEIELTTSDAVIAEVAFILTSKKHYQLSVTDASGRIATLLRIRGMKLRDKRIMLHALDLWRTRPKLGFVDALSASYAQLTGTPLATFDSDFDTIPNLERWSPL